jgi:hypothetical protein
LLHLRRTLYSCFYLRSSWIIDGVIRHDSASSAGRMRLLSIPTLYAFMGRRGNLELCLYDGAMDMLLVFLPGHTRELSV